MDLFENLQTKKENKQLSDKDLATIMLANKEIDNFEGTSKPMKYSNKQDNVKKAYNFLLDVVYDGDINALNKDIDKTETNIKKSHEFENLQTKKENKPIASLPVTNSASLNIYDISYGIEDELLVGYDEDSAEWVKINYTDEDAYPYFDFNGERYSTDLFMKNEALGIKTEVRKALSVSEYNKLKIALNKNNSMKGNFILHPGQIREISDYKMSLSIYGAFRNKEHSQRSQYIYNRNTNIKNDEATRDGVGIKLYEVFINLIDESIKFSDINSYYVDGYIRSYQDYLLNNDVIKNGEIDIESLSQSIINVAKNSKKDLEAVLRSKNFIYNLTGKRKTQNPESDKYNLNLESKKLNEDFDPSMPSWLARAIKMQNTNTGKHKDYNFQMALDTMKWTVEKFPEKGKLADIGDNEYIALLIDKSGDEHKGEYIVYFPAAYIGNNETIYINGRNRRIDSMSLRSLAPYVKEYAHSIDSTNSKKKLIQKRNDRYNAQSNSIDRQNNSDYYTSNSTYLDKSGYIVDPKKYQRLLAQNNSHKFQERLEDLYVVLSDLRTKLKDYSSQDDFIPDPSVSKYRRPKFNNFTKAMSYYDNAVGAYASACEELNNIMSGKKSNWNKEAFEYFENYVKESEKYVVSCLDSIK